MEQVQAWRCRPACPCAGSRRADRLPVQALLDRELRALGSWVDSGCPCGHAQFPRWSQHLVALLHVLSSAAAAGTPGLDMAPSKICQVRPHASLFQHHAFFLELLADGIEAQSDFI